MIRISSSFVVIGLIMAFSSAVPAEEESFLDPVGEGIKKIISAPLEIPKSIADDSQKQNPLTGVVTGTVKGTVRGVGQVGQGTADAVTLSDSSDTSTAKKTNLDLNQPVNREEFEPWMDRKDPYDNLENFDPSRGK